MSFFRATNSVSSEKNHIEKYSIEKLFDEDDMAFLMLERPVMKHYVLVRIPVFF